MAQARGSDNASGVSRLALPLLVAGVLADHHDASMTADDLALIANFLDAGMDLHRLSNSLLVPVDDASTGEIVGRQFHHDTVIGQDADVVHAHLAGNMGEHFVPIVEFHPEHGVRE